MSEAGFLLDTNVISEVRRKQADPRVVAFLKSIREKRVCLSVLTIGELRKGAEARHRSSASDGARLSGWVAEVERDFRDRLLGVDHDVADVWGRLSAQRPRPVVDTLIAATAIVHDMTLVTRNVTDIRDTGVAFIDPWAA